MRSASGKWVLWFNPAAGKCFAAICSLPPQQNGGGGENWRAQGWDKDGLIRKKKGRKRKEAIRTVEISTAYAGCSCSPPDNGVIKALQREVPYAYQSTQHCFFSLCLGILSLLSLLFRGLRRTYCDTASISHRDNPAHS